MLDYTEAEYPAHVYFMLLFPSCDLAASCQCAQVAGGRLAKRVRQRSTLRAHLPSRIFPETSRTAPMSMEGTVSENIGF